MRTMAIAFLTASAFALMAVPAGSAAPLEGAAMAKATSPVATPAHYVRRHGRVCYRKCYREFVIGRRVCRTYCGPF